MKVKDSEVLSYHNGGKPGKLEVIPSKPCLTQRDLSMAYLESRPRASVRIRTVATATRRDLGVELIQQLQGDEGQFGIAGGAPTGLQGTPLSSHDAVPVLTPNIGIPHHHVERYPCNLA